MDSTNVKDPRLVSIFVLYDMHTDFFASAIDGISDDDAHTRLGTKANHVAWLAGSLVESRYEGARHLGLDVQQRAHDLFKNHQGIQDGTRYPTLEHLLRDWKIVTPLLREATLEKGAAWLDERFEMEGMEMSNYDMVAFSTYREANMIGQIALWRRLLGYEPMKYM